MKVSGNVKMLDGIERDIIMTDRTKILIEDVRHIGKEPSGCLNNTEG